MSNKLPHVAEWYEHLDKGQQFQVIATDMDTKTIEIQNFDGDTGEYSFAEWRELEILPCSQPDNWSGAYDIDDQDDLGTEVTDTDQADWDQPAKELRVAEDGDRRVVDDYGDGFMVETSVEGNYQAGPLTQALLEDATRTPIGIIDEKFNDDWRAEYCEDPNSGLWRVDIYDSDVAVWSEIELDSLADARISARNFYEQA
jgi:hypothetical protein